MTSSWQVVLHHHEMEQVAVLPDQAARIETGHARARDRDEAHLAAYLQGRQFLARKVLGEHPVHEQQRAGGVTPVGRQFLRQQPAAHLIHRPRDGRDGGNAEALIHLGALRVIDARDHPLHAEGLAGDPGARMLELSPEVTAAKASAFPIFASLSAFLSNPDPSTARPLKSAGNRRKALRLRSMTATE